MSGFERAGKLHACSTHCIPFPYSSCTPANRSAVCKWGEGLSFWSWSAGCARSDSAGVNIMLWKSKYGDKIIEQHWNWEQSQTHNVWEYASLAEKKRFSENNESQQGDEFPEWQNGGRNKWAYQEESLNQSWTLHLFNFTLVTTDKIVNINQLSPTDQSYLLGHLNIYVFHLTLHAWNILLPMHWIMP